MGSDKKPLVLLDVSGVHLVPCTDGLVDFRMRCAPDI
jgi:hypothetical protein